MEIFTIEPEQMKQGQIEERTKKWSKQDRIKITDNSDSVLIFVINQEQQFTKIVQQITRTHLRIKHMENSMGHSRILY